MRQSHCSALYSNLDLNPCLELYNSIKVILLYYILFPDTFISVLCQSHCPSHCAIHWSKVFMVLRGASENGNNTCVIWWLAQQYILVWFPTMKSALSHSCHAVIVFQHNIIIYDGLFMPTIYIFISWVNCCVCWGLCNAMGYSNDMGVVHGCNTCLSFFSPKITRNCSIWETWEERFASKIPRLTMHVLHWRTIVLSDQRISCHLILHGTAQITTRQHFQVLQESFSLERCINHAFERT